MSTHPVAIVAWLWLAAGATFATPAAPATAGPASATPPGPAPSAATPSGTAPSAAAESLKTLWGARLLHALVVADVGPGSVAEKAGLRIGDVLESYDRITVDDVPGIEEFTAGLKSAARKGPVSAKIRRFEGDSGPPKTLTVELRLPEDPQARVGLAVHPGVFFLDMTAEGAAAKAGIKPWDCIDSVEGEEISEHPRLSDFEAHLLTLKNKDGNVRLAVGRWRPAPAGTDPKIAFEGEREVTLPIPKS